MELRGIGQGGQIQSQDVYKGESLGKPTIQTEKVKGDDFSKKDLDKAITKLNKFLEDDNAYAEYKVHERFGDIMIKIIDSKTKDVIMEVPPKKILDMVAKLCEMAGVVFDKKA